MTGSTAGQVRSYTFTALAGSALQPGSTVQAPLLMRNAGSAPLRYRLTTTTMTGSTALADVLQLQIHQVPAPADCATGTDVAPAVRTAALLYEGGLAGAGTAELRVLPVAAAEVLCFRVVLPVGAPATAQGVNAQAVFSFRAEEV